MNSFNEIAEYLFTGEMTFASGAVMFVVAYWVISILTGLGLDALDFDLDFDTDTDVGGFDGFLGIGLVPLRWLNLGSVPFMVWMTFLSVSFFAASIAVDQWKPLIAEASSGDITIRVLLNLVAGLAITKIITQPMRNWFNEDFFEPSEMVGSSGTTRITTGPTRGKVFIERQAGDLISEARTTGESIPNGTRVAVVGYDSDQKVYIVAESPSKGEDVAATTDMEADNV
jgi:hypothetical protein|tara:strand:- start:16 stop:699 length:684 start_codon:yes stop_codon:yes gene_type:complete